VTETLTPPPDPSELTERVQKLRARFAELRGRL
jgi:hypothetical protein